MPTHNVPNISQSVTTKCSAAACWGRMPQTERRTKNLQVRNQILATKRNKRVFNNALLAVQHVLHRTVLSTNSLRFATAPRQTAPRFLTFTRETARNVSTCRQHSTEHNTTHVRMRTLHRHLSVCKRLLGYISTCVSILRSHPVASQHISPMSARHPMGTKCNNK